MYFDRLRPDETLRKAAQEDFTQQSVKLKQAERELQDFLKQTGFLHDSSRVWVNGFGRSVSQRAVHADKKVLTYRLIRGIIKIGKQKSELGKFKKTLRSDSKVSDEYYFTDKVQYIIGKDLSILKYELISSDMRKGRYTSLMH